VQAKVPLPCGAWSASRVQGLPRQVPGERRAIVARRQMQQQKPTTLAQRRHSQGPTHRAFKGFVVVTRSSESQAGQTCTMQQRSPGWRTLAGRSKLKPLPAQENDHGPTASGGPQPEPQG
jgi:hypothetical protein